MKNVAKKLFKIVLSGVVAAAVLNVICLVYYNPPKAISQLDKYTNFKYEDNKFWSSMKEGFGYGKIDGSGYNNPETVGNPDIVVIGSSHTEALQVAGDENYSAKLERLLKEDTSADNNFTVKNLGISGTDAYHCIKNIGYIPQSFDNLRYIIVEIHGIPASAESLSKAIPDDKGSGELNRGIIYRIAQKFPYIRLLNIKISEAGGQEIAGAAPLKNDDKEYDDRYAEVIDSVMKKIYSSAEACGAKPVIMYHSPISVTRSGDIKRKDNGPYFEAFKKACSDNGVEFINVSDSFVEHYKNTYEFPYGFSNTVPGEGHLNKVGHGLIAECIYRVIGSEGGVK